ncbi:hypothetical protein JKY79_02815 [Candidatus Babeliales bacterium]|nr:hypothetical protein [Candidatus Babeliales bacterium]
MFSFILYLFLFCMIPSLSYGASDERLQELESANVVLLRKNENLQKEQKKDMESLQLAMKFVKETQAKNEELKRQFSEKDEIIRFSGERNKKSDEEHQKTIKKLKSDYIKEQNRLSVDKENFSDQIEEKKQEVARLQKQVDSQSSVNDEALNKLQGKVGDLELQNEKLKSDNTTAQNLLQKSTTGQRSASIKHAKEVDQLKKEQEKQKEKFQQTQEDLVLKQQKMLQEKEEVEALLVEDRRQFVADRKQFEEEKDALEEEQGNVEELQLEITKKESKIKELDEENKELSGQMAIFGDKDPKEFFEKAEKMLEENAKLLKQLVKISEDNSSLQEEVSKVKEANRTLDKKIKESDGKSSNKKSDFEKVVQVQTKEIEKVSKEKDDLAKQLEIRGKSLTEALSEQERLQEIVNEQRRALEVQDGERKKEMKELKNRFEKQEKKYKQNLENLEEEQKQKIAKLEEEEEEEEIKNREISSRWRRTKSARDLRGRTIIGKRVDPRFVDTDSIVQGLKYIATAPLYKEIKDKEELEYHLKVIKFREDLLSFPIHFPINSAEDLQQEVKRLKKEQKQPIPRRRR